MRMTMRPDARTVEITDAGARGIDTGSLCMPGSFERALILTFDGPARAEDFEFVGQPPRPVMTPLTDGSLPAPVGVADAIAFRDADPRPDGTELAETVLVIDGPAESLRGHQFVRSGEGFTPVTVSVGN
jgi:hypothetical protein